MPRILSLVALLLISQIALAGEPLNLKKGVALAGYDPVSYFQQGPMPGSKSITTVYKTATYYFTNQDNKSAFLEAPENYLPQYGGWCAYAMLEGEKVDVNPKRYKIVEGKLYLFYDKFWLDTLKHWDQLTKETSEEELINKADKQWQLMSEMAE
ncbi:YHS domain-containing (seleno)protein [Halioxenophilus sp. WMMB6]|uniref:YHS domain-containing (seleno)protein n=1 Tax=Halioxenophilus sp. WMMB6 TaxID=3073815 RepID=UPI00295EF1E0|nr:YHS domain-containing (seleno)protein [Halioxenophilus sp. WMMB6]